MGVLLSAAILFVAVPRPELALVAAVCAIPGSLFVGVLCILCDRYPLRGIIYFDPLFGFCLQCLIYGIAVGFAKHFGRYKLGLILVAMTHVASVFLCPHLT